MARPAVTRGMAVGEEHRRNLADDKEAQKVLFGQRARAVAARARCPVLCGRWNVPSGYGGSSFASGR